MRLVIGVASADAALRSYVAVARNKIVPPEAVQRGYLHDHNARLSIQILALGPDTADADIDGWLRNISGGADGLILLVDPASRARFAAYEDAYFIEELPDTTGRVLQNEMRATLAPVLRHFSAVSQRFDRFNNQRILLLPLDIFVAEDLAALRLRLTADKMKPGLGEHVERLVASLARRARPKRQKHYRSVYLVDDRPLWYRYGPEEHKIVQTVTPPHPHKCWHNSRFRFGRSYNDRLHHNVDDGNKPSSVNAVLATCHGDIFNANGDDSHLNIFPNGFI